MATTKSMVVNYTDWYIGYNGFSLSCYWLHNRSGFGSERSGVPLQRGDSSASVDFLARKVAMEPVARHRDHLSGRFSRQSIRNENLNSHFFTNPGGHNTPEIERGGT